MLTHVFDRLVPVGEHQLAQRHDVNELLRVRCDQVDRVYGLFRPTDFADVAKCALDGPRRGHRDELRRHDATGRVGWISQQESKCLLRRRVELLQESRAILVR